MTKVLDWTIDRAHGMTDYFLSEFSKNNFVKISNHKKVQKNKAGKGSDFTYSVVKYRSSNGMVKIGFL